MAQSDTIKGDNGSNIREILSNGVCFYSYPLDIVGEHAFAQVISVICRVQT